MKRRGVIYAVLDVISLISWLLKDKITSYVNEKGDLILIWGEYPVHLFILLFKAAL